MNIIDKRKQNLIEELKDKEYRDEYVSSSIDVGVAFQIRALREQRGWNQTKLAEEANMQQERISTLENPSHSPTLSTLKKLAKAFDVGLIVRFVPISDLVKRELNLPNESLEVPSFDKDSYFNRFTVSIDITALREAQKSYGIHQGAQDIFQQSKSPLEEQIAIGSGLSGSAQQKAQALGGFYVGITSDIEERLFGAHKVPRKNHWRIHRQASSVKEVRKIEAALLGAGLDGGGGGGGDDCTYVYCYKKTNITDP